MTDDAPPQPPAPLPVQLSMELPPEVVAGAFADFASIWHTQSTFVLDFLATIQPPIPQAGPDGAPAVALLPTRVVARVRIPSEQIFLVMQALRNQADQWLAENGRTEPPESFFTPVDPSAS